MLDIEGDAVLALWNGFDPERTREYNAWHTREHVPERISIPGMTGARRYVRADGPLPEYLTLYAMSSIGVLTSEPYRALLNNPTPWSLTMRPSFRDFLRLCCRRILSIGGGLGGALGAIVFDDGADLRSGALREALERLLEEPGILAAHVLERDRSIPDVPFAPGGTSPDFPDAGTILLEGYDAAELWQLLPVIRAAVEQLGLRGVEMSFTTYTLAYALDRNSLERTRGIVSPATART